MIWFVIAGFGAFAFFLAYLGWRNWVAPWQKIEGMIQQIGRGGRPASFLIDGGERTRRAAISLEDLFNRQQWLDRQISERSSGTETIIRAMQDGLIVVDAKRHITLVNETLRELFGLQEDVLGRPLLEVVRNAELDELIALTLQAGAPQRSECTIADAKAGVTKRMQLSSVAMKTDANVITGVVVLLHDITQLKLADEVRRDFVANVSHELRTPLSILKGYIETLLSDPDTTPNELSRILEVMNRHSNRLHALVDDLLSLAQLESAHPNLHRSDIRISELFAAIVRDWGKKFAEKKLSIEVGVDPDMPILRADETRLHEILYNLLDNAVKYSNPGGKIRLQAQRRDNEIVLSVADRGVGIPEADLPRIFERFYRTDKARSRELGGTGLGLSIVKHIAQMHGGNVQAESALGRGTTIRVALPLNGREDNATVTET